MDKHVFAVFSSGSIVGREIVFGDHALCFRIGRVLRLQPGDNLIVFNDERAVVTKVLMVSSKLVRLLVEDDVARQPRLRKMVLLAGLSKRKNFEDVLSFAAELGVDEVIPLLCHKAALGWFNHKDERLLQIITAAREQAKNYYSCILRAPLTIEDCSVFAADSRFLFDVGGDLVSNLAGAACKKNIVLAVGPEGGFVQAEVDEFLRQSFVPVKISTGTILTQSTCVAVAVGLLNEVIG